MVKYISHSLRVGMLCLLALSAVACQKQKPGSPVVVVAVKSNAVQTPQEETPRKQREIDRLQQCQEQLSVLRTVNEKQYQHAKQAFDNLMSGASQYAKLRTKVNGDIQETVDALYRYKANFLCAGMNQAVLAGLLARGEQIK